MDDAGRVYGKFLDALSSLVEELASWEPNEEELGNVAAALGPLSNGVVAVLAEAHARHPDEKVSMEAMTLDEVLAYLAERLHDDGVMSASRAAADVLAARRWLHYGSFARPEHDDAIDFEFAAAALDSGLKRLMQDAPRRWDP